jgi:hypothetical protein
LSGRWSGLPADEIEELARLVMIVVCEEWSEAEEPGLGSADIRERLVREGIEVPDYALADVFERPEGWFLRLCPREPNPDVEAEARDFRLHGGVTVEAVEADLCG